MRRLKLTVTDEQRDTASGSDKPNGDREDVPEAFHGAEHDNLGLAGEVFRTGGNYIDIRQCKRAGHFFQEGGFLVIRFDEGEVNLRRPDRENQRRSLRR